MLPEKVLVQHLQKARETAGIPFTVTSGARCLEHNRRIGSKDTSSHIKGLAVDIKYSNSQEKFIILFALYEAGFVRLGINEKLGFIHADLDVSKPQKVLFTY